MYRRSPITLSFFGTGSQYNPSRSHSCLGLSIKSYSNHFENWIFDCGDAALRQMINNGSHFNRSLVSKIFITHLHVDHCSGLVAFLASLTQNHNDSPRFVVDIYGPPHLCGAILPLLYYSQSFIGYQLHLHELLSPGEQLDDVSQFLDYNITAHAIYPDEDGFWTCFSNSHASMRSGCLQHNVPCRGYCYEESFDEDVPSRKISIFGDTYDSESMKPLVQNSDVLVHEATMGPILSDLNRKYLHENLYNWKQIQEQALEDPVNRMKWDKIKSRASSWGHSSLEMVGKFAQSINAKEVILTHIGGRYDAKGADSKKAINYLFEQQVEQYFDGDVVTAYDGYQHCIL